MKRTRKALAWIASGSALFAGALLFLPSCGGDETEAGVCSIDDHTGCPDGQRCRLGRDERAACFCSPEDNSGCDGGQLCLADPNGEPACYCSPETEAGCGPGLVCEEVSSGYPACFPPVTLGGRVFDLGSDAPIGGAHVLARDANYAAVSGVAVTGPDGRYALVVPAPRNEDGTLRPHEVFLRADAQGFVTFPTSPRVPLPIDVSRASGEPLHLESSATDVGMLSLPSEEGLGTITGKVLADVPIGTLVVAGGETSKGGGATGIADSDGSYTVFNVPAGTHAVRGYKLGLQLDGASASVAAGATTAGVDLAASGEATAIVSGKIEIVNPGAGQDTSVILVVDETFVETAARGEAPPGLRTAPVTGEFSLVGVPDGNYVVLAAFENDFLTRDPDQCIGGTELVRIQVAGGHVALPQSFKVTGSLDVVSPDNEQVVSGTPEFVWKDDSSEVRYEVRVYDAFGTLVWEKLDVPNVTGEKTVTVPYGGPALQSGMLYQFRATSIRKNECPISITEDLRGVFLYR